MSPSISECGLPVARILGLTGNEAGETGRADARLQASRATGTPSLTGLFVSLLFDVSSCRLEMSFLFK